MFIYSLVLMFLAIGSIGCIKYHIAWWSFDLTCIVFAVWSIPWLIYFAWQDWKKLVSQK